jgi:hypothetical protein
MARKVQMDTSYIFTPSANRITIDKAIPLEKLLLITNLASNTVIYNFSDPNLKVSTYTRTRDSQIAVTGAPGSTTVTNLWPAVTPVVGQRINGYGIPANTIITTVSGTSLTLSNAITADPYLNQHTPVSIFGTVIVLNYNTSSMNVSDKLQIFIDEYEESVRPAEVYTDPVSKQRVSTPQSLIDTDFEYGLQPTKWETAQLTGNRPSYFYNATTPIPSREFSISSASRTVTVDTKLPLTGTHTVSTNTITGVNTRYLTELKVGSVLYDNNGVFCGYIAGVTTDTNATLKANGATAISGVGALVSGQRFFDNGAPGSGVFSPSGTITNTVTTTPVTGTNTFFTTQLRAGDYLYNQAGSLMGVIASIASDTSLTLAANSLAAGTAAFGTSQYSISSASNTAGNPLFVQLTTNSDANGSFLITGPTTTPATIGASTIFTYDMEVAAVLPSSTIATTAASGTGTVATLTFAAQTTIPYAVGSTILVSGVTPVGYNTVATGAVVLSCTTTQVTYLSAGSGAQTVAGTITSLSIYDNPSTYAYPGVFYAGAQIGGTPTSGNAASFSTNNGNPYSIITVTTAGNPHNLMVGNAIFVTGTSNTAANGNWYVSAVTSPTTFEYVTQTNVASITAAQGRVYTRQLGNVLHRPTDGGVRITANTNSPNSQLIRQTRRYFRYQSGKGVQYSTGTIFKPSLSVDNLVSDGTRVTVTCKDQHNLYPGAFVNVSGATSATGTFNGTYVVESIGLSNTRFTYIPSSVPTNGTNAGGYPINVSVNSWTSAINRLGMFDLQNGMFFKFDGTTLFACRRSSTELLPGVIAVTSGSSAVIGTGTKFSTLLRPGNMVVIRGMSYMVTQITSDTTMNIAPEYRGTTISGGVNGVKISKTIDLEIPQSDWNIDRCDGTGPSGFNIDLTRMQMWYIDYSWYGAGAIRYGFKDQRGEVIYCNRIAHANTKTEAYMRSGNLPARYETNTIPYSTTLSATLASATTTGGTISVADASQFPSSGFVYMNPSSSTNSGLGELIEYSSKNTAVSPHTLTITSRALAGVVTGANSSTTTGSNAVTNATSFATTVQRFMHVHGAGIPVGTYVVGVSGTTAYLSNPATATSSTTVLTFRAFAATTAQTYTFNAATPVGVSYYNPQFAPNISHWGSAAIMDGRYDDDKSLIFTGGMPAAVAITAAPVANVAGAPAALISIRISPSVDTGIGDILGRKEIVNRMQLALNGVGISSDRRLLVDLRLNGQVSGGSWQSLGGSSLAQVCYHTANTSISGGESIFSFYTSAAGGGSFSVTSYDLTKARDLGNCILGGGSSNSVNQSFYPDGPDILTMVVRNLEASAGNAVARISWTEAQA